MLHPSFSRGSTVINGVYANQFGSGNTQATPTAFQAYQKEKLSLAYTESFALRVYLTSATAQHAKVFLNEELVSEFSVMDKFDTHISAAAGVINYDGAGSTNITLGTQLGKPVVDGGVFTITDFLTTVGKSANFVLALNNAMLLYLITPTADNNVGLYQQVNGSWALIQNFAVGHAFVSTDKMGFKITPAKIELIINDVSVWEKARTWTVSLSSADLGTIADTPTSPYTFGQSVDLTLGSTAGTFTVSVQNQSGAAYKIDQSIEVLTQTAPEPTPVMTTEELLIPLLAASMTNNLATDNVQVETTDWGKIATWGGMALAAVLLLAGVIWAVRGK